MFKIRKYSSSKDYVGKVSNEIIDILGISLKDNNIYIGGINKKHIRKKHKKEFEKYIEKIPQIISEPDYL